MRKSLKIILIVVSVVVVLLAGIGIGYFAFPKTEQLLTEEEQKDPYLLFAGEVYDKIRDNYWEKMEDKDLSNLFELAAEKLTGSQLKLKTQDKEGVLKMMSEVFELLGQEKKKPFVLETVNLVLVNLKPANRSGLYSIKQKEDLKNTINNINTEKDLYEDLGVNREATDEEIQETFEEKKKELETQDTPEAQEQLEDLEYAHEVLSDENKKERYEKAGIEPTVFSELLDKETYYIKITKVSPNTFIEFQEAANWIEDPANRINTLIIDLRENIGGTIDFLPTFLGPFVGPNRYAYEYFSRGENIPFKTETGWLPSLYRYKKVVILIDEQTQSSAEVMAAALKKFNVGVLIGTHTRGWGTVERAFPIENQIDENENYSVFLVHSLTLRDDGQPIEGKGVDPDIDITSDNWEEDLLAYYNSPPLVEIIKSLY